MSFFYRANFPDFDEVYQEFQEPSAQTIFKTNFVLLLLLYLLCYMTDLYRWILGCLQILFVYFVYLKCQNCEMLYKGIKANCHIFIVLGQTLIYLQSRTKVRHCKLFKVTHSLLVSHSVPHFVSHCTWVPTVYFRQTS